jgi:hypothetical protein
MRLVHEQTLQPEKLEKVLRDERKRVRLAQMTDEIGIQKRPGDLVPSLRPVKWNTVWRSEMICSVPDRASFRKIRNCPLKERTASATSFVDKTDSAAAAGSIFIAENDASDDNRRALPGSCMDRPRMKIPGREVSVNELPPSESERSPPRRTAASVAE